MTHTPATYWPGSWVAVTSPKAWLLLDSTVEDARLPEVWQAMNSDNSTDATLQVLLGSGLNSLSAFALVDSSNTELRIVVRHPAIVRLHDGNEIQEITSNPTGTWVDQNASIEWNSIELLSISTPRGAELPLALGITAASGLAVSQDGHQVTENAAPPPSVKSIESTEAAAAPSDVELTPSSDAPPAQTPPESIDNFGSTRPETSISSPADGTDEAPFQPEAEPEVESQANRYEQLLGATMDRDALIASLNDIAQKAPPNTDTDENDVVGHQPDNDQSDLGRTIGWTSPEDAATDTEDDQTSQSPTAEPPTSPRSGLIDGIPGISLHSSPELPTTSDPAPIEPPHQSSTAPDPVAEDLALPTTDEPDSDEAQVQTVNRAALLKSMEASSPTGPTVLAVTCPAGHLTSAYGPTCRVCGAAVKDQRAIEILRPPLGFLRLSTGQSVVLDRDIILGRAPIDMTADPALKPNLVQLTESDEVSRMHVRITLDGWQPMIRDLDSANGTTLKLRDGEATALRPLQDYPLEAGCEVSLAEIVTFTYEVKA